MQGSPTNENLLGEKFNKLTVIKSIGKRNSRWLCQCDCGNQIELYTSDFINNHTTSCGCMDGKGMLKHGLWKTRFYRIYDGLKRRCNDKKNLNYFRYGGRNIKCEWKTALDFKNDMYQSYLEHCEKFGIKNTQIERINNDGNYCKNNCKWATTFEQSRNKRDNIYLKYRGKKMIVTDWAFYLGINRMTIYGRVRRGLSINKILSRKLLERTL